MRHAIAGLMLLAATTAGAAPVRARIPEGTANGAVVVTTPDGATLAHGQLTQWLDGPVVTSRLLMLFGDGSRYDEQVRFTQRPVFRIRSYRLRQTGPSFPEMQDVAFDAAGRWRARTRAAPGDDVEEASGREDFPDDLANGLVSVLLKNLPADAPATVHLVAFSPKPRVVELHLRPEGTDRFRVGSETRPATRWVIQPEVTGVTGFFASAVGKQPEALRMWIAQGRAPALVKFEGSLYVGGPVWRVMPGTPQW